MSKTICIFALRKILSSWSKPGKKRTQIHVLLLCSAGMSAFSINKDAANNKTESAARLE
jgi:hypothetical protein